MIIIGQTCLLKNIQESRKHKPSENDDPNLVFDSGLPFKTPKFVGVKRVFYLKV